jgi:hypothetical protein
MCESDSRKRGEAHRFALRPYCGVIPETLITAVSFS